MNTIDFILLIPCYNNPDGLLKSINSVQYPKDRFEILVVDDGSSLPIVKENFVAIHPDIKIQILRLKKNQGILNALNAGLEELSKRTEFSYIARLDAGDTCHPERFIKQVRFLNIHSDISLLGTWCRFEDPATGKGYNYITKTDHGDIVREMHFKCSFIHPTVMFRKEVLNTIGYYPEGYLHAEDYAYFWMILKKMKGAVLAEILVDVECRTDAISSKNYKKQLISRMGIVNDFGFRGLDALLGLFILRCKLFIPVTIIQKFKKNR